MSNYRRFTLAQAAETRGSYTAALALYRAAGAPRSVARMRARIEAQLS